MKVMTCKECDKIETFDIPYSFRGGISFIRPYGTYTVNTKEGEIIEPNADHLDFDDINVTYDFCELVDEKTDELFIDARNESSLYNTFDVLCPYKQEYVKEEFGEYDVCGCNYPSIESNLLLVLKPRL